MRFLFITKRYPPEPDASGQIAFNLAQELNRCGHEVDVIARAPISKGIDESDSNVFYIPNSYWDCLREAHATQSQSIVKRMGFVFISFLRKIYLALKISSFPDVETSITKKIVKRYKSLIDQGCLYDGVVAFFRPYSNLSAAITIKDITPSTFVVSDLLDLVEEKDCPALMPKKLYSRLIKEGDLKVCTACDAIILPQSVKEKNYSVFNLFPQKVIYCEFPSFINRQTTNTNPKLDAVNEIEFVFAGTLNQTFRNPMSMLNGLSSVADRNKDTNFKLHIYGSGNCVELIENYITPPNFSVEYHGKVPKKTVNEAEEKADFLINIANSYESIVPSKIFELFALGKPVINFINKQDDGSLKYFNKYPICCSICFEDKCEAEGTAIELSDFIYNNRGALVDYNEIKKSFYECTPEYVTSILLSRMEQHLNECN